MSYMFVYVVWIALIRYQDLKRKKIKSEGQRPLIQSSLTSSFSIHTFLREFSYVRNGKISKTTVKFSVSSFEYSSLTSNYLFLVPVAAPCETDSLVTLLLWLHYIWLFCLLQFHKSLEVSTIYLTLIIFINFSTEPAWIAWGCKSCLPLVTFGYLWLISFLTFLSQFLHLTNRRTDEHTLRLIMIWEATIFLLL